MKYLLILTAALGLYAFNGVDLYKKGEYKKAEKEFLNYLKTHNSAVAKAYLGKIYYKEGRFEKAEKTIQEVLKDDIPPKVRKELQSYLAIIRGVYSYSAEVSAGLLYDSNVNNARENEDKKNDLAHIEEALLKGSYLKRNFLFNASFKIQNRGYIKNSEYNYVYLNAAADVTYYSYINSKLKLNYEMKTKNSNTLLGGELYFYKNFGIYHAGLFGIGEYYTYDVTYSQFTDDGLYLEDKNEKLENSNLGGGLRLGVKNLNFKTDVSLYMYEGDSSVKGYDSTNYRADVKTYWHFSQVYWYVNYYYNLCKYDENKVNMHYLDVSFNKKETKHIYSSMGFTTYYARTQDSERLKKYEIYAKFIYSF